MKIEHWHRRHALSLASMLPDGRDDAMVVLDCVRELVTAFLQVDAPEPAKAKIVTLVRDCQELSVWKKQGPAGSHTRRRVFTEVGSQRVYAPRDPRR